MLGFLACLRGFLPQRTNSAIAKDDDNQSATGTCRALRTSSTSLIESTSRALVASVFRCPDPPPLLPAASILAEPNSASPSPKFRMWHHQNGDRAVPFNPDDNPLFRARKASARLTRAIKSNIYARWQVTPKYEVPTGRGVPAWLPIIGANSPRVKAKQQQQGQQREAEWKKPVLPRSALPTKKESETRSLPIITASSLAPALHTRVARLKQENDATTHNLPPPPAPPPAPRTRVTRPRKDNTAVPAACRPSEQQPVVATTTRRRSNKLPSAPSLPPSEHTGTDRGSGCQTSAEPSPSMISTTSLVLHPPRPRRPLTVFQGPLPPRQPCTQTTTTTTTNQPSPSTPDPKGGAQPKTAIKTSANTTTKQTCSTKPTSSKPRTNKPAAATRGKKRPAPAPDPSPSPSASSVSKSNDNNNINTTSTTSAGDAREKPAEIMVPITGQSSVADGAAAVGGRRGRANKRVKTKK